MKNELDQYEKRRLRDWQRAAARFQTRLVDSYRTMQNGQVALLCWSFEGQSSLQNTQVVCAVGEVEISRLPSSLLVKNAICAMSLT